MLWQRCLHTCCSHHFPFTSTHPTVASIPFASWICLPRSPKTFHKHQLPHYFLSHSRFTLHYLLCPWRRPLLAVTPPSFARGGKGRTMRGGRGLFWLCCAPPRRPLHVWQHLRDNLPWDLEGGFRVWVHTMSGLPEILECGTSFVCTSLLGSTQPPRHVLPVRCSAQTPRRGFSVTNFWH